MMRVASTGRLHASGRYKERKWGGPGASCLRALQRKKVGRAWGFMPQGVTKTESGAWLGLHASGRYKDRKWGVAGASCLRALQRQKMGRGWGFMPQGVTKTENGAWLGLHASALQRQKVGRGWGLSTLRAPLFGTLLQTLPDLVTPLKGHSLSPCSCPATRSAPSERFLY